jgi:hypothetical protein
LSDNGLGRRYLKRSDELKIKKNYRFLKAELDTEEISDYLFEQKVLLRDDIDTLIETPMRRRSRVDFILKRLLRSPPKAYSIFRSSLEKAYTYVSKKLDSTGKLIYSLFLDTVSVIDL